ncbi:MAG: N-acetylneuraminate synthase family protein [Lachnospiraceae bacterium]|nr:N-acetylneuraminate synthase family protein [Lachnospiraceae bacterium]MDY5521451.1 N-acetylneuraminate synthase family protein [Agathobacter sp.]
MRTLFETLDAQGYFIIAEVGVNYYDIAVKEGISNMEAAKIMCRKAKEAGADAVKFQSYKAEKIASRYSPSYWDTNEESTTSQFELFKKYDSFGKEEYQELSEYCMEIGILFMSTPFDYEAADYLDEMMDYYKISSSDITNIPFIRYMCKKGKPILLSTGASDEAEIEKAVNVIKENGNRLVLMHCVLQYPTPEVDANLGRILALKKKYPELVIGYSDHTKPNYDYAVVKTAFSLGAVVIEKHFTLDKGLPGNDHYHAIDVNDLTNIKKGLEFQKKIIGQVKLDCNTNEEPARKNARRSIVLVKGKKAGEFIHAEDIEFKRPGIGIAPENDTQVIGKKVQRDLPEDTILQWSDIQ